MNWKFWKKVKPKDLPNIFKHEGKTIIHFTTHGCQAQIHEFDYIGVIVDMEYRDHDRHLFYKVKILKDRRGEQRDNSLQDEYRYIPSWYLQQMDKTNKRRILLLMTDVYPKFIIEDGRLVIGRVTYHYELIFDRADKTKVKGGGWWKKNKILNMIIFYADSDDFGKATLDDVKKCVEEKKVYSSPWSDDSIS